MKTIELTDEQIIIIRDLLLVEEEFLEKQAIPNAMQKDKPGLTSDLNNVREILTSLKNAK